AKTEYEFGMVEIAGYGNWESPLAPDALAQSSVRLGFPLFGDDGSLYFTELRSAEQGRCVVVRRSREGKRVDLLPAPFSAGTRGHEYGGGSLLIGNGELWFVTTAAQQLYGAPGGADPRPVTREPGVRLGEPLVDPWRERIIAVAERHAGSGEPENFLVSIEP